MIDFEKFYKGKNILITGGAGFLGSNLAHALVSLGAKVTILDSMNPLYGGNLFNLNGILDHIAFIEGDIRNKVLINELVIGKDIIFSFAAQVSYIDSSKIPFEDLDINCSGHLTILEACRKLNSGAKVIFSSSRLVLGKIIEDPMTESHPTNPLSLYGIHKLAAEKYHLMYYKDYGIPTVVLRITNPYGVRQQVKHDKYSIPGWFMRLAMEGKTIKIFGDGTQIRDYIYVSDIVNAFLGVAGSATTAGEIYNCGSGVSMQFREMVETIVREVGSGSVEYVPWPESYERVETGDFRTDISKISTAIEWRPMVSVVDGVRQMVSYYKKNMKRYL